MRRRILLIGAGLALALGAGTFQARAQSAPPTFTITELGTLPGTDHSWSVAVNASGQVIGGTSVRQVYYPDQQTDAFFWSAATGIVQIPRVGTEPYSRAFKINDFGEVITAAGIWKHGVNGNVPVPLPGWGAPQDLNNSGQIVGSGANPDAPPIGTTSSGSEVPRWRGILWEGSAEAGYQIAAELSPLPGDNQCRAWGINEAGVISGYSQYVYVNEAGSVVQAVPTPVRWVKVDGGWQPQPLPAVPGLRPTVLGASRPSEAGDILLHQSTSPMWFFDASSGAPRYPGLQNTRMNSQGQICGWSDATKVYYWDRYRADNAPLDLGTLGGSQMQANAIGDAGDIVGWAKVKAGKTEAQHAFLWVPAQAAPPVTGGQMHDLHNLTPSKGVFTELTNAAAVNASGRIAGQGKTKIKVRGLLVNRAFVLTPTN